MLPKSQYGTTGDSSPPSFDTGTIFSVKPRACSLTSAASSGLSLNMRSLTDSREIIIVEAIKTLFADKENLSIGKSFAAIALSMVLTAVMPVAVSYSADGIETVARLGADTPPGNIAVGPDGRIFLSVHRFYGQDLRLVELLPDGSTRPYPNNLWANAPRNEGAPGLHGVLGLNVDRHGVLWMLDGQGEGHAGRLIGWDTKAEKLRRVVYLAAPVTRAQSFLNDLAVDRQNDAVYIADMASAGKAAIIVVDLKNGQARRVLEGSRFTLSEDIDAVIDGVLMKIAGKPARAGINPITVDPDNKWVYFGAMSGTSLYRVRTKDLLNARLDAATLEKRIERYGDKPISDGITIDGGGNVYVASITDDSIGVTGPDGRYKTLYRRDDISWPDGLAYGPDHKIYVTVNELHRAPLMNDGKNISKGEFKVMRFDALRKGRPGR